MSRHFTVSSLPLKDVVRDLAEEMNTSYLEKCTEYVLDIPENIGSGKIRGINFNNGLGIIIYQCTFNSEISIKFTVDKIHPLKYLYTDDGYLRHQFSNKTETHYLKPRMCALVASEEHNGHILHFGSRENINIISLEIDRKAFIKSSECQLSDLNKKLQEMFADINATNTFYHDGFYSLEFQQILDSINMYEDNLLIRKLHLESKALKIFVEQIKLYEDDLRSSENQKVLRYNELERIKQLSDFITKNLSLDLSIDYLSKRSGLNPSKLQSGFKYIFNKTVREYVEEQRMNLAKSLLFNTPKSIATIASEVGLENPSYFSKVFKEHYNYTPTELRNIKKG